MLQYDCTEVSVAQLKKVLQVQAKALRPMPAYLPSESEAQLAQAGVDMENLRERRKYFLKFVLSERDDCSSCSPAKKSVKKFLFEVYRS